MSVSVNHRNMACIDCHQKISDHEVSDFRICIYPGARASFWRIKREFADDRPNIGGTETVETKDLPVDLNDTQTETCILEFVCDDCIGKRQEAEEKRYHHVLKEAHKFLHPEIRALWRQVPPSRMKLQWEEGKLIRQLIRHGTPYLMGLTVIDGREIDLVTAYQRAGLVDASVTNLSGGLPASYRMFVQQNRPNAMDLLVRYLRLTDFINCIFVYRLTEPNVEEMRRQLEKRIISLAEEYRVQITEPEPDKSVLVIVVRQTPRNTTENLLDQIEGGRVTAYLVPQHVKDISECLTQHCKSLELVQPPTPISSTELELPYQAINVNCHRVGSKGLYGFVDTIPMRVFFLRPRNPDHPPKQALFVPMRFQSEKNAETANSGSTDYELKMLTPMWNFSVNAFTV